MAYFLKYQIFSLSQIQTSEIQGIFPDQLLLLGLALGGVCLDVVGVSAQVGKDMCFIVVSLFALVKRNYGPILWDGLNNGLVFG